MSVPLLPKVQAEIERMVQCGVIEEITEPTEWCAPMVAVSKKTEQIRICVDLKQLNKAVKIDKFVLPTIDDILPKLAHAQVFSLLDAASGFWQLPLDIDSAKLTTFITPFGRYFFRRLPFGITSAPEIFQRKMSAILKYLEGVAVFMDNILVYGNTPEEHEHQLHRALEDVDRAGLKLNTKMSAATGSTQVLRTRHRQGGHTPRYNKNRSYHTPVKAKELLRAKENAWNDSLLGQVCSSSL